MKTAITTTALSFIVVDLLLYILSAGRPSSAWKRTTLRTSRIPLRCSCCSRPRRCCCSAAAVYSSWPARTTTRLSGACVYLIAVADRDIVVVVVAAAYGSCWYYAYVLYHVKRKVFLCILHLSNYILIFLYFIPGVRCAGVGVFFSFAGRRLLCVIVVSLLPAGGVETTVDLA